MSCLSSLTRAWGKHLDFSFVRNLIDVLAIICCLNFSLQYDFAPSNLTQIEGGFEGDGDDRFVQFPDSYCSSYAKLYMRPDKHFLPILHHVSGQIPVGQTNTEYRNDNPEFGTNRNHTLCPTSVPHTEYSSATGTLLDALNVVVDEDSCTNGTTGGAVIGQEGTTTARDSLVLGFEDETPPAFFGGGTHSGRTNSDTNTTATTASNSRRSAASWSPSVAREEASQRGSASSDPPVILFSSG
jgi:hypothetical protein